MSTRTDDGQNRPDYASTASQVMASWADSFATVLESMTAQRPKIESRAAASGASEEGFAWWGQKLSILQQPSFWIGAPAESWAALGRMALSALGVEEPSDADLVSTCRDLMAQTSAVVASQLAQEFGEEMTGGDSVPTSQPDDSGAQIFRWSLDAGLMSMEGAAVLSEAFLGHCSGLTARTVASEAENGEAPPQPGSEAPQFGGRPLNSIPNCTLRVKFVLGRTTLPMRDVFRLNVGSVIMLDQSALDPAYVVTSGRVLARGQVVVINGNYGLKICQHDL
jgi:flagellar motor switch protein FliN/FliY